MAVTGLFPAATQRPQPGRERRNAPRVKTIIPVTIQVTTPGGERAFQGRGLDVSVTGMSICAPQPLDVGDVVWISMAVLRHDVTLGAKVMRCQPTKKLGRWSIGVMFEQSTAVDQLLIREFFEQEYRRRLPSV